MNIVLIGMRGSGKSSVAHILAKRLGRSYIEMDDEVVKIADMTIAEIFAKHGPQYFRDRESEVIDELASRENLIISTGGGAILRERNIAQLKKNAVCIWLKAPAATLAERIMKDPKTSHHRPRLTDKQDPLEEVIEVLKQRGPLYEKAADEIVDTESKGVEQIVDEILQKLKVRKQ